MATPPVTSLAPAAPHGKKPSRLWENHIRAGTRTRSRYTRLENRFRSLLGFDRPMRASTRDASVTPRRLAPGNWTKLRRSEAVPRHPHQPLPVAFFQAKPYGTGRSGARDSSRSSKPDARASGTRASRARSRFLSYARHAERTEPPPSEIAQLHARSPARQRPITVAQRHPLIRRWSQSPPRRTLQGFPAITPLAPWSHQ